MSWWPTVQRLFTVCPISLRDLFARPNPDLPSLPDDEQRVEGGRFRYDNSVPVLSLAGDHTDIGRQEGALLSDLVGPFLDHYISSALGRNRTKWNDLKQRALGCREFLPDRYLEEMHAIAGASGMNRDLPLYASVFLDFYSLVLCSCISIAQQASNSGRMMLGRNLDFPPMGIAHRYTLLKALNPDGYYRHVHLTWPGLTGVLTGINEHGLTLALSEVDGADPFGCGLPYTLMHRRILEECRSIDETEQLLRSVSRTRSNNLMVADSSGDAVVFEYDRTGVTRRSQRNHWVYATNHFVAPSRHNQPFSLKYVSASRRYHMIARAQQEEQSISEGQLFELLEQLALGRLNLASMIIYPQERHIDLRIGAPPAARRRTKQLDLRPYLEGSTTHQNNVKSAKNRVL